MEVDAIENASFGSAVSNAPSFPSDPIVHLDVGGAYVKTRLSTLTWGSSYFRNILNGPFKESEGFCKENPFFLDCDENIFSYVLQFLRYRELPPNDTLPLHEIRSVARAYTLEPLLDLVEARIEEKRILGCWWYKDSQEKHEFMIFHRDGAMWYYDEMREGSEDEEAEDVYHEKLHKAADGWYVTETRPEFQNGLVGSLVKFRPDDSGRFLFSHMYDHEREAWKQRIYVSRRAFH
eukprot:TRINITY_DN111125_c0_g1_i1.p1 TRINITY_DN111125_c0_g1~~TRINITY_DN111125_c0_g1_i1.p1  ORF type:complete len:235 (-),score=16.21 TRINITY_DN111125_c0_g1_i1:228-932(-)